MNRIERLRADISLHHRILEIGPYFNPIAPKALGYRATTLDVFSTAELRRKAAVDPNIPREKVSAIEDVDLVGSASDLADLTHVRYGDDWRFDWILSSHNIEHVPNPIRFLQQCAAVLRPEGILRLAIPDKRFCFDHFRPLTDPSELLQAFHENRTQPTVYQVFREESLRSERVRGRRWRPVRRNVSLYREWFGCGGTVPTEYIDTHCWAFTPESFELTILDLAAFGLVNLVIDAITDTCGHEFFVDLRRPTTALATRAIDEDEYHAAREWLLRRCIGDWSAFRVRPAGVRFVPRGAQRISPGVMRKRGVLQRVVRESTRLARQLRILATGKAA